MLRRSYYNQVRRHDSRGLLWTPEHGIIAALIEQAISDGIRKPKLRRDWDRNCTRREARRWIAARSYQPGGFAWCCQWLELDPDQVALAIENQWHGI